jgi:hypothetical protein
MQLRSLLLIPLLALSLGVGPCIPGSEPDAGPIDAAVPPPDAEPPPAEIPGCDGAVFRGNPVDASARGPRRKALGKRQRPQGTADGRVECANRPSAATTSRTPSATARLADAAAGTDDALAGMPVS